MKSIRIISLVLACTLPLAAAAQWVWLDKDGRKVFSDRSPPADVPAKSILKMPGAMAAGAADKASAAAAAASGPSVATAARAAASAPRIAGRDKALEDKKLETEKAEEAKRKAEEETQAKARAEACDRARRSLIAIGSGERVRTPNAKGELEFMTDDQRAAETKRLQATTADCKS